jgi:hypothetical protein
MECLVRTTLDINDDLLSRAKAEAARQRTTLTRLIEEGLRLRLESGAAELEPRPPFRLRVFEGGSSMRPDIDPTSNASLLAAADEEYDLRQAGHLPFRDPGE